MSKVVSRAAPRRARLGPLEAWVAGRSALIALALVGVGFLLRLGTAWGTFLNPDEALHFYLANQTSWRQAYHASLGIAHPPLLILLLYWLRPLGGSELLLRLPSVLAGTAFCWVFFQWLDSVCGRAEALIGAALTALLWPVVSLSAEARQYELLLLFLAGSTYSLERALAEDSTGWMALSVSCLGLGLLENYSAFLFAAALGVYAALRLVRGRIAARVRGVWALGQVGALALGVFFYRTHIAQVRTSPMITGAVDGWLRDSYFHWGAGDPLDFFLTRTLDFFAYMLGQPLAGYLACAAFAAGVASLWRRGARALAVFLCAPFAVVGAAAVLDCYPYGGTRHCAFLAMPAAAGMAAGISRLASGRCGRGLALALALAAGCAAFASPRPSDIARADQSLANMEQAVAFVRGQGPRFDPIFVDHESGVTLARYLCPPRAVPSEDIPGFLVYPCVPSRFITPADDVWSFDRRSFLSYWSALSRGLRPGQSVWVARAGWSVALDEELRRYASGVDGLGARSFGNNIKFFHLTVSRRP